jgi:hypothetical protein
LGAGVWIAVRGSPPAYIENWQQGAEGERKTEKALRRLDVLLQGLRDARGGTRTPDTRIMIPLL